MAWILAVVGLTLALYGAVHLHNAVTPQVDRDADCTRYVQELNGQEHAHGLPGYTFYRCENGGVANGT